jgi:hypothetical protein
MMGLNLAVQPSGEEDTRDPVADFDPPDRGADLGHLAGTVGTGDHLRRVDGTRVGVSSDGEVTIVQGHRPNLNADIVGLQWCRGSVAEDDRMESLCTV